MKVNRFVPVFLIFLLCGCATTPYSIPLSKEAREKTPGKGIPYYLPRPYLVVTKNLAFVPSENEEPKSNQDTGSASGQDANQSSGKKDTVKTDSSNKNNNTVVKTTASGEDVYSMQVIYLPDPNQKYALYSNRGTGVYDASATFVDGWKLIGLNTKSDAKTVETIQAIGSTIKETASGIATTSSAIAPFLGIMAETKGGELEAPGAAAPTPEETPIVVGIWVFDLMETPFKSVFTWTMTEKK